MYTSTKNNANNMAQGLEVGTGSNTGAVNFDSLKVYLAWAWRCQFRKYLF